MTDTHCHLSFAQYDKDRDAVRDRAAAASITRIINPGTDLEQSRAAVRLAAQISDVPPSTFEVYAAVGVHPQDIATITPDGFEAIAELAHELRVVAIGEVGFEISPRAGDMKPQEEWLERFVDLAVELEKPLIFHVRSAHVEFRRFLAARGEGVRGVVHCFSGSPEDAAAYVERGLLLGITGIVTYPNAPDLQTIVQDVPLENLLLETDAPFLAPQTHRGKRNEPAYLVEVAEKVAELKGLTVAEVEHATDENATRLFRI